MKFYPIYKPLLLSIIIVFAGACAQGGGEGGTGIVATGTVTGVDTGLKQVSVNHVSYASEQAQILRRGVAESFQNLKPGVVVVVEGRVEDSGERIANRITVAETIRGVVESVSSSDMTVLGQTVILNKDTILERPVLSPGVVVEVHGFVRSEGEVLATRIDLVPEGDNYIFGFVSQVDTFTEQFTIGTLTMDYSQALIDDDDTLAVGAYVEVKIVWRDSGFSAESITFRRIPFRDGQKADLVGFISAMNGEKRFTVNNTIEVRTDEYTDFIGGDIGDLAAGIQLRIVGHYEDSNLHAKEIIFLEDVYLEAQVLDVQTVAGLTRLRFIGLNLVVEVTANTKLVGLTMEQLALQPWVAVRARENHITGIFAVSLRALNRDVTLPEQAVVLQGHIDQWDALGAVVVGESVPLSNVELWVQQTLPVDDDEDAALSWVVVPLEQLPFDRLPGQLVVLQGVLSGQVITWKKLMFENDPGGG